MSSAFAGCIHWSAGHPGWSRLSQRSLQVHALAITPVAANVPTFRELGYDIDFRDFVGLTAPAKTPKPITGAALPK